MRPSILIAGIGNIFLGDDGFGVEVARRLSTRNLPDGVRVIDFGIRGFDLAFALLDGYDATILVDATPRGGEPGTLYTIDPDVNDLGSSIETHNMNPVKVLSLAKSMGAPLNGILIVGCEPSPIEFGPEEGHMGLSEPVAGAISRAVETVESLVAGILNGGVQT